MRRGELMERKLDSGFDELISKLRGQRKQWDEVLRERLSERPQHAAAFEDSDDEQKSLELPVEPLHQIGRGSTRLYSLLPVQRYQHKLWKTNNYCEKCMQPVAAGYDCIQCNSCNITLHRDCCEDGTVPPHGGYMCSDCWLGVVEQRSHTQKKRGEESLKMRVLASILRIQASYRMRSKRKAYARVKNGVLRLQACFRRKRMNEAVLKGLLSDRFPTKIRLHMIQVVRSDSSDGEEEAWFPARPEEVPLGNPMCDMAARLEHVRHHMHLGGFVHKYVTTGWFNEAVAHPAQEEFPDMSYALTLAVFEPHDLNEPRSHDASQVFRIDIPLTVTHLRTCYDGSEVVTLVPKKHTVLLPSTLAASNIVCTLTEVQSYPRARFIGQVSFDLSNYAPWRQCTFVKQECGPCKYDIMPDLESRILYRSGSDRSLASSPTSQPTKVSTARNNTIAFAVFPSSSTTCKAGPAVELSNQRAAVAVRRRVWLVVIENVLAIYDKMDDHRPKQVFGLKGCNLAYDPSQSAIKLQQSTGKLTFILLTNDVGDWLLKLGINKTPHGSNVDPERRFDKVSFASLGELSSL